MNNMLTVKSEYWQDGKERSGEIEEYVGNNVILKNGAFSGWMMVDRVFPINMTKEYIPFGWCEICESFCYGDCQANGLKPTKKRYEFAPYHKGDTGTVYYK